MDLTSRLRNRPDVDGCDSTFEHFDDFTLGSRVYRAWGTYNAAQMFKTIVSALRIPRQITTGKDREQRHDRTIFLRWLVFSYTSGIESATPTAGPSVRLIVLRDNIGGDHPDLINNPNAGSWQILGTGRFGGTIYSQSSDFLTDDLYPRYTILSDRICTCSNGYYPYQFVRDSFVLPLGFPVSFSSDTPVSAISCGPGNIVVIMCGQIFQNFIAQQTCFWDMKVYFDDFKSLGGPGVQEGAYIERNTLPGSDAAFGGNACLLK